MISDFLWCREDSFDQISEILLVSVSDCSSEKIVASLEAEEISQAFFRITWRIHQWKTPFLCGDVNNTLDCSPLCVIIVTVYTLT